MKELSLVFSEKSDVQHRGNSILNALLDLGITERHVPVEEIRVMKKIIPKN